MTNGEEKLRLIETPSVFWGFHLWISRNLSFSLSFITVWGYFSLKRWILLFVVICHHYCFKLHQQAKRTWHKMLPNSISYPVQICVGIVESASIPRHIFLCCLSCWKCRTEKKCWFGICLLNEGILDICRFNLIIMQKSLMRFIQLGPSPQ